MKELDLKDPLYKNLEPSFNVADSNLTNEIKYDKIQKNGNFYSFLFLTVIIFIVININK